ncbi:hypothetical protein JAAARDRAFT_54438 [Jaapia argillacea MUCL 33604]|uniref:Uncharacterized protein n=1 Tax=Jaapia argillacea MUCL 33604 TaxID=933084 RepID=A0A067QIS2_9AGAM|nr:hypothetical protein JAAARDRAFT_54438 [Jaapia argillacea MUCL 33604]
MTGEHAQGDEDSSYNPEEDEEEDDELMLGAEDNHTELYGTQRVVSTSDVDGAPHYNSTSNQSGRPRTETSHTPANKKRKVTASSGGGRTGGTKNRKYG